VARAKDLADALIAEGNEAEDAGKPNEACEHYRSAVAVAPRYARAHLNLGLGLEAIGDIEAAFRSYEAALAIDPGDAYANYNLGRALHALGDLERAERLLRAALDRKPEFPEALVVLSNVHDSRGDLTAALASVEHALKQRPEYAGAWYNRGDLLRKLERMSDGEASVRRAIELAPNFVPAYELLGSMLRGQSRITEAIEVFAAARVLAPDRFDLESMELHTLGFSDVVSEGTLAARHRAFGVRLERAVPPRFSPLPAVREPERRLRVGYVSNDFNLHPISVFCVPVFERHDRAAYQVYSYSTGAVKDVATRRLERLVDVWRDVHKWSDTELADVINRDKIDVLVDLTGHAGALRLGVFAQQPAPVQVAWLGYLGTTGLTRIGYRLCDAVTDPSGLTERWHSETLVRLPYCQWCYRPFLTTDPGPQSPLARNGYVTFGSFNHMAKLSPTTRRLWAEVLNQLPDSQLLLVGISEGQARDLIVGDFARAGVSTSRVRCVPRVSFDEYFRCFDAVDIALDTLPYSGGTTTCDALWMGVPVLTVPGSRSASRSAASILSAVGLSDWIARSAEEYVRIAVAFSGKRTMLSDLRKSLRGIMRESPLMDEARFVNDLERAYRSMWRSWCQGEGGLGRPADPAVP
jgi:protein O-GlcNAc transferase